jgi:predicted regulator of Ras-like GTPase activity (Roadblock/LC7/MglB family)
VLWSTPTVMPRASPELSAVLASLVCRVPGALAALLVDRHGVPLARSHGDTSGLEAPANRLVALLRRTLEAAERLDQGPVGDVLLEAERRALALVPLRDGCCLLLLVQPAAPPGHVLFEARRAAAALTRVL